MIHPSSIIDPGAKIAKDVNVGPFSVIGPEVTIGSGCVIESHVVIKGPTKIGNNNHFYQFSSIGEDTQDKKFHGERAQLTIGDNNVFREGCTVHRGTKDGGGITSIGNNNLFMINTHVAHDCIIGNHIIFSNNASVAGHVKVEDYASLGGFAGVHQFCLIGAHSFIAAGSIVLKDVAPYITVSGHPATAHGLNSVGLARRNFSADTQTILKQAYKIIFRTSATVKDAIVQLNQFVDKYPEVILLKDFLQNSTRGIVR